MSSYYKLVQVNWVDPKQKPLKFWKGFLSGWPDYWTPGDFTRSINSAGGLLYKDTWYPLHAIKNIQFGKEQDEKPEEAVEE